MAKAESEMQVNDGSIRATLTDELKEELQDYKTKEAISDSLKTIITTQTAHGLNIEIIKRDVKVHNNYEARIRILENDKYKILGIMIGVNFVVGLVIATGIFLLQHFWK